MQTSVSPFRAPEHRIDDAGCAGVGGFRERFSGRSGKPPTTAFRPRTLT